MTATTEKPEGSLKCMPDYRPITSSKLHRKNSYRFWEMIYFCNYDYQYLIIFVITLSIILQMIAMIIAMVVVPNKSQSKIQKNKTSDLWYVIQELRQEKKIVIFQRLSKLQQIICDLEYNQTKCILKQLSQELKHEKILIWHVKGRW